MVFLQIDDHGIDMDFHISNNTIKFDNGSSVTLPQKVRGAKEVDGVIVAVLEASRTEPMTENVVGITSGGHILWKIQPIPETATDPFTSYVEIINSEASLARIANWNGMVVDVDVHTGVVKNKYWGK
jgi:hypothetical protein